MSNTRKSNGDGSLRQRPDGRWEGRYTAPDGRQRSVYGKTKTACRDALKRKQAEILTGVYLEPSRMTVQDWLETWLTDYCGHIKLTTRRNYNTVIHNHFIPLIGRLYLSKLTIIQLQRAFNELAYNGLQPSTLKTARIVLSSALGKAVAFGILKENPCAKLEIAKVTKNDMTIVDRQHFPAFVKAASETDYGVAILFLLQTGIRFGELRGIRWSDIDMDSREMTIARQIAYDGHVYFIQTPKNNKPRKIVLMEETVDLLKRHRTQQAAARLASGRWTDDELTTDLVFRLKHGSHYHMDTLTKAIRAVGAAIGLPTLHPHDLRHSYAVAALRSGIDVKTVQNNLGHSSAALTLDTYASYTTDMGRVAAEKLSEYWDQNSI